jgi:predicted nucleotidyltransferase component of viral defense system
VVTIKNYSFDFITASIIELKGGTSLSKGFSVIERFSEDIDIRIEPPKELGVRFDSNHDKPADR